MRKILILFFFAFSGSGVAAPSVSIFSRIEKLHDRIVSFDFQSGSELGPIFIYQEARDVRLQILRSMLPKPNARVTWSQSHYYLKAARAFNRRVVRSMQSRQFYRIEPLPTRQTRVMQLLMDDYLNRHRFARTYEANQVVQAVRTNNFLFVQELLRARKRQGLSDVGFDTPQLVVQTAHLGPRKLEKLRQIVAKSDFDVLKGGSCELWLALGEG